MYRFLNLFTFVLIFMPYLLCLYTGYFIIEMWALHYGISWDLLVHLMWLGELILAFSEALSIKIYHRMRNGFFGEIHFILIPICFRVQNARSRWAYLLQNFSGEGNWICQLKDATLLEIELSLWVKLNFITWKRFCDFFVSIDRPSAVHLLKFVSGVVSISQ